MLCSVWDAGMLVSMEAQMDQALTSGVAPPENLMDSGPGRHSEAQHLPRMCEALGSTLVLLC